MLRSSPSEPRGLSLIFNHLIADVRGAEIGGGLWYAPIRMERMEREQESQGWPNHGCRISGN
jgi:hypothetical protein